MALKVWAALVYWTGKVTGTLVAETVRAVPPRVRRRHEFTAGPSAGRWQWARSRSWNAACLAAVAHRICSETWPATVQAIRHQPQMSCYDTVCSDAWCVYACVYYVVAWLDRASEVCALVAAVTWRRRSTVQCLNSAAAGCVDAVVDRRSARPKASDVPWNAYLIVAFPVVQFAMAATEVSPSRDGVWHAAIATAAAVASCAPVVATGTAAALLTVANSSMRSINHRITRVRLAGHHRRLHGHPVAAGSAGRDDDDDDGRLQRIVIARLAHKHWKVTELVTDGVCGAFSVDLMLAVLLAAVRVTYVAISVFHCLTQDVSGADGDARAIVSLTAVTQLIAWFGQFAYLARTCDELTAQSSEMFDNLNSLLLDIFKASRISGETYPSQVQEIEAVQEFMRQVAARKVTVHACSGLIMLNLSLITTIIGVTLTYFIVLLQFESSHDDIHNNTIAQ